MDVFVFAIAFSVVFIFVVLDLVRRKRLKEQYSLLWLLVGLVLIVLSSSRSLVEKMASYLHIYYAPSMLFLFGLIFCFTLILHLTVVISKLNDRVVRLTQEVALLKEQLSAPSKKHEPSSSGERKVV
ncbi:hypothetical protein DNHGIG_11400 [Collibacillus ludicampi]|jgi:hypothetical protein|uniref:DUF2304 domain-containing protein n=1 Tax=Collibacillus ludicampi TaxID=2771369 RepID=A0AAV4LCR8_9BACL|nr:DUF2304 domain-containing protein [Collibacillus ludicampi]GIM45591.1 hypothetical protein DNHGIG_11400 [Collibacillus ludicampi]